MNDLTQGSLRRALLRLSLPLAGSMALETLFNVINGYWVGHLGTTALAAVNLSSFSVWLLFALAGMVSTGTNSLVAQRLGAGQREEARRISTTGVLSALALGFVCLLGARYFVHDFLLWQAGPGADVQTAVLYATNYLRTVLLFAPIYCLNDTASAILRAHGDTRTPLLLLTFGFGLNFVLDPLLILGYAGFPRLEVWGASLASGLSFTAMGLIFWSIILRRGFLSRPNLRELVPILKVGLPPSLSSVFFCVVFILVSPIVGHFGPEALAALGLGHRVEGLGYLLSFGISLASITLVGQNIGAGRRDRARQAGWAALQLGAGTMLCVSALIFVGAEWLARFFSDDPLVIQLTVAYLRLMTLTQVPTGIANVVQGLFSGAGRSLPPTLVGICSAGLRYPLARYFAITQGFGLTAIWLVIVCLTWIQGLCDFLLFVVLLR